MNCVTVGLARHYASMFVQCWDYYAVQQGNGSYRPSYQRLSLARLQDHLMGRYTLGTYMVDAVGYCSAAVFDDDREDGLERLVVLAGELATQGISSVVEASRRGGHVWVVLDKPTPARVVRAWLMPYAAAYGVELYPKQDIPRAGGVGSLVRLPLGVHRKIGGWYPFVVVGSDGLLVPVGETVAACCAWLGEQIERVAVPADVVIVDEDVSDGPGGERVEGGHGEGYGAIRQWCASQDIVEVLGRYTRLNGQGVGCCPLPGHHSRGDVHPSFQVFGGADAHWYCYTWGRAGDLFDFLRFYHGLTVREAWERLQAGTL